MKTYRVIEEVDLAYAYDVQANSPDEAIQKLENNLFAEGKDVIRCPEYDETIRREAICDDEGEEIKREA